MREILNINKFIAGLITNVDQKDIPLDAGVLGTKNLDPNENGKLKGAYTYNELSATGGGGTQFEMIEKNDSKRDLIIMNGGDTQIITDIYGTPGSTTDASADSSACVVVTNEEAHVGCGTSNNARWNGYIRHTQFGGTGSGGNNAAGLYHTNSEITNNFVESNFTPSDGTFYIDSITQTTATEGYFTPLINYAYCLVPVYDGYQEAPMSQFPNSVPYPPINMRTQITVTTKYLTVVVKVKTPTSANFNRRITSLNLYRCEYIGAKDFSGRSAFRLVKDIDINDAGWSVTAGIASFTYVDYGISKYTYEESSGIPETLDYTGVKWSLSCQSNGYHFVGKILHTKLTSDDGSHLIYRSMPLRYDIFNWTKDFIRLPFVPKAMCAFNNKVFVFDDYQIAKIEPEYFIVEDIYSGAGCESKQGFTVTEFGIYFANSEHCWEFDGNQIKDISIPIQDQWQAETGTIIVGFSGKTNQVLFMHGSTSAKECYAYHIPSRRWDYYDDIIPGDAFDGVFTGIDGYCVASALTGASYGLYKIFGGSTRRSWVYISPEYDFDEPGQLKKFHKVYIDESTATVTTTFGVDGASPTTAISSLDNNLNKTFQLKLSGNATAVCDAFELVFRRMIGKR